MTIDQLIEAWRVNNVLNLELLDVCADNDLELKPGKGKTIRSNFVHLIGVRSSWAEESLRAESQAIPKLDWKTASRDEVREGLAISHDVMAAVFRRKEERGKWNPFLYFGYVMAHEAHHRSQIEIALRINGREPDDKFLYSQWEWGNK